MVGGEGVAGGGSNYATKSLRVVDLILLKEEEFTHKIREGLVMDG